MAFLGAFGVLAVSGVSAALPYAPAPTLSIVGCSDQDSGIAVQIAGLLPGSSVTILGARITQNLSASSAASVTATSAGSASATLPSSEKGEYAVTVNGVDADGAAWSGTATVTVVKSCEGAGTVVPVDTAEVAETVAAVETDTASGLAKTGSDSGTLAALGAGAILFGGAAVIAGRNRRVSNTEQH